jgi:hypothetical protein
MASRILWVTSMLSISLLVLSAAVRSQDSKLAKNITTDTAPAPSHDISGTWLPANGPKDGIQVNGVKAMPADGKPEHTPPFTPYGLKVYKSHHPLAGYTAALPGLHDDPRALCEPLGFPRINFYNLREIQILQTGKKVAILYSYAETWRDIFLDGRKINPVDGGVTVNGEFREARWYGYSAGKWVDDTTLVDDTYGMMPEDRVWLDEAGRPISDRAHVIEEFHRVSPDRLELTVTIDDPKMYTKPWIAMNKFPMKLEDPNTDVQDMYCSPLEMKNYDTLFADPASGITKK